MTAKRCDLVMAFYPNARGFAYAVFEGPLSPVDWGMSDIPHHGRVSACVRRLSVLTGRYRPDVLVLRKGSESGTGSANTLIEAAEELAAWDGLPTYQLSRKNIKRAFADIGSPTRYAIAEAIAKQIPMFAPLLPPPRKIWNGEDGRMGLFDAAALALTFFAL